MGEQKIKKLEGIFLVCACTVFFINIVSVYKSHRITLWKIQTELPWEPGVEFKEFKNLLYGVSKAGFLTDKDISPEKNDGQFLGAQYMLAPTVLKLSDASHDFIILDYETLLFAYQKIRELNAVIIETTPYGKILARKR